MCVTLSFVYGTKCNNILDRHNCNNIAVTTTKADTSAKCNTVVYASTCCTKCKLMILFSIHLRFLIGITIDFIFKYIFSPLHVTKGKYCSENF